MRRDQRPQKESGKKSLSGEELLWYEIGEAFGTDVTTLKSRTTSTQFNRYVEYMRLRHAREDKLERPFAALLQRMDMLFGGFVGVKANKDIAAYLFKRTYVEVKGQQRSKFRKGKGIVAFTKETARAMAKKVWKGFAGAKGDGKRTPEQKARLLAAKLKEAAAKLAEPPAPEGTQP